MKFLEMPLSEMLKDRRIFAIFDDEFQNAKAAWLDVTALIHYDGTFTGLYDDGTVPKEVLDGIAERLRRL